MKDGTKISDREAVRLPLWAATGGGAAITYAVMVLQGAAWRPSLAGVLSGVAPILFGTEVARSKAWSPLAVLDAAKKARLDAAPPVPVPEFTKPGPARYEAT